MIYSRNNISLFFIFYYSRVRNFIFYTHIYIVIFYNVCTRKRTHFTLRLCRRRAGTIKYYNIILFAYNKAHRASLPTTKHSNKPGKVFLFFFLRFFFYYCFSSTVFFPIGFHARLCYFFFYTTSAASILYFIT